MERMHNHIFHIGDLISEKYLSDAEIWCNNNNAKLVAVICMAGFFYKIVKKEE